MKNSLKTSVAVFALMGAVTVTANQAQAGGFAVREQSAEGQGASYAGIAAGGSDLSSMFFNPATITLHDGMQFEGDGSLILPYSKATNGVGLGGANSGNIGKPALVPSAYASYQLNDKLFFGLTVNAPFGLVTKGNSTWAGSFHGVESDVFMMQAGPVIGYKLNDMISVAASVRGVYADMKLTQNAGVAGVGTLTGKDWSYNYSAGIIIKPTKTTRVGIGYNSATKLKAIGNLAFSNVPPGPPTQPVYSKLTTPGTLTVGLRQQLSNKVTALLGFEWADWSKMKQLAPINRTTGAAATTPTPFNWKDSYFYSAGLEYKYSDFTTLRTGFAYEDSPVPDATRGVRVPDANRYWLSVGASQKLSDRLSASVGFTHIIAKNGKVNLTAPVPLTATFKQHVNIINASLTFKLY